MFSVKKIQSGNEIPDSKNVNKMVFKFSLMESITSPFIPKIATPASPTKRPGNMYLSKSKPIAANIVPIKTQTETIIITKVRPIFCFNGLSMFTKGIPSAKRSGTTIITPVM